MSKKVQAETFNLPEKKRKSYKCRTRKRSTEVNRKKYIYKHTKKKKTVKAGILKIHSV